MADTFGFNILAGTGNKLQPTTLYGYIPSKTATLAFIVLFAISTITHVGQAIYTKNWWLLPTICICGAVEVAGWGGRFWSHHAPTNYHAYLLQICTTIMAPTFMLAANFIIFGRIIKRLGTPYSRLPPKWYSILFISGDVISLLIQATGGGIASKNIKTNPKPGGHIMLAGIAVQLIIIIIYTCLAIEFYVRYFRNKPFHRFGSSSSESLSFPKPMTGKVKIMSWGLAFSTTCLFIRSVYRLAELGDGWVGRIIRTQVYFNVLDGAMVTLAIFSINFIHPGFFVPETDKEDTPTEKQPHTDL